MADVEYLIRQWKANRQPSSLKTFFVSKPERRRLKARRAEQRRRRALARGKTSWPPV